MVDHERHVRPDRGTEAIRRLLPAAFTASVMRASSSSLAIRSSSASTSDFDGK
ncbi:hypothetical protein ACFSVJ_04575 [Prauserella oleivorans]